MTTQLTATTQRKQKIRNIHRLRTLKKVIFAKLDAFKFGVIFCISYICSRKTIFAMRHFFRFLTTIMGIITCCSCSSEYKIDGSSSISGLDGQKLYLRLTTDGETRNVCLDSCEVIHGCFNFSGAVDSVAMVELYMGSYPMMPVVIENGNLFVQMDNVLQTVSGGPLNDRLNDFLTKHTRLENDLWDLDRRARYMIYEGKSAEDIIISIDPLRRDIVKKMQKLEVEFVKANYDNPLGPGYFIRMFNSEPHDTSDEMVLDIVSNATPAFLAHPFVRQIINERGMDLSGLLKDSTRRTRAARRSLPDSLKRSRRRVRIEHWD